MPKQTQRSTAPIRTRLVGKLAIACTPLAGSSCICSAIVFFGPPSPNSDNSLRALTGGQSSHNPKWCFCVQGNAIGATDEVDAFGGTDGHYDHITATPLSPFEPMLSHMLPVDGEGVDLVAPGPDELPLKARSPTYEIHP